MKKVTDLDQVDILRPEPASSERHVSRRRGGESGVAMVSVVMLSLVMAVLVAVVILGNTRMYGQSSNDREFEEAAFAAESGAEVALDELVTDPSFYTVAAGTDLSTRTKVIAAAEQLATNPVNIGSSPAGEYVIVIAEGSKAVYAVGATPSFADPSRRLRVVQVAVDFGSGIGGCWPEGAIVATGLIETGNSNIASLPSSAHAAHAIGNSNFKGSSSLYVDGDVRVAGTVTNTSPANVYGTIQSGAPKLKFPSSASIGAWQAQLVAEAQAGGTRAGINTSSPMTLTAPIYVDGSIVLNSGASLTIEGPGTVYVNGHFELKGNSTVSNGAVLGVRDFFKQGGGTSYSLNAPASQAGLISFYADSGAIEFEGSPTGTHGVIYSARGGVAFTGSARFEGSVIAGGAGPDGLVKFGGGPGMTYPAGLLPSVTWLPTVTGATSPCVGKPWFPNNAILANGNITMSGNAFTTTAPASQHQANIHANGDYSGSGNIDGLASASGTAGGGTAYLGLQSGAAPFVFHPQAEIDAWQAELIAAAQVGGTMSGSSYGSDVTITTPKYVNGDLTISGSKLTLTGGGVLYVTGKVTVSGGGSIVNDGILAAGGLIKTSGGSTYQVNGSNEGTLIVGFAVSDKALELSGGSSGSGNGIAYAPNGGIKLTGTSTWQGALLAAGGSGTGKVELSGGSNVQYPSDLLQNETVLPKAPPDPPTVTAGLTVGGRSEL